jgi:chaperonin GroEL
VISVPSRKLAKKGVRSLRSAIRGGVVSGGGTALYYASLCLNTPNSSILCTNTGPTFEEEVGARIVMKACGAPIKVISHGIKNRKATLAALATTGDIHLGIDVRTHEVTNLLEAGVTDPLEVVKASLLSAAQTASLVLSLKVLTL